MTNLLKLLQKSAQEMEKVTSGRHSKGLGQDDSSSIPSSGKAPERKHVRADTMTHQDFKLEKGSAQKKVPFNPEEVPMHERRNQKPIEKSAIQKPKEPRVGVGISSGISANKQRPEDANLHKSTPRQSKKQGLNEDAGDYVNARQSKFSNTGEDIKSSARHKAYKWKGLQQAEDEGRADEFDHLLPEAMGLSNGVFASDMTRNPVFDKNEHPEKQKILDSMRKIIDHLKGPVQDRMIHDWRNSDSLRASLPYSKLHNYWLSRKELFARAFEKYIDHKLSKQGRKNTYLTGVMDHPLWTSDKENKELEPLFDELMSNFKSSEFLKKSLDVLNKSIPKGYIYVAMDGDNAGAQVEKAALKNDVKAIEDISERIKSGSEAVKRYAEKNLKAQTVIFGGDDLGFLIPRQYHNRVDQLRKLYQETAGFTITAGIANTIPDATKALLWGKMHGKNQSVLGNDKISKEIDSLKSDKPVDPKQKIIESGVLDKSYAQRKSWKYDKLYKNNQPLVKLLKSVKDKLSKAFYDKGRWVPEKNDRNHPEDDRYKVHVNTNKSLAWTLKPKHAEEADKRLANDAAGALINIPNEHHAIFKNMVANILQDRDRHARVRFSKSPRGKPVPDIKLRHIHSAIKGYTGNEIRRSKSDPNRIYITAQRHGQGGPIGREHGNSDIWSFDGNKFQHHDKIDSNDLGENLIQKPQLSATAQLKKSMDSHKDIPHVATVGIISGNSILMGKRNDNGKYTTPGGHLNPNEDPKNGAFRELMEEANIQPESLHYLGSELVRGRDGNKRMIHAFAGFGKHTASGRNDPDKEVSKWEWVDCSKGVPENVRCNLHSPKNVLLSLLGVLNDKK